MFVNSTSQNGLLFPIRKNTDAEDVNLLNYINSKLVYALRHTKE
jgi:hypothetical protein